MHNKFSHTKYIHTLQLVKLSTIQQETLNSLHLRLNITENKHSITPTDTMTLLNKVSIFLWYYSPKTLLIVRRTSCALWSYQIKALAVCARSIFRISGSNPAGDMDVCLLRLLCVAQAEVCARADHSSTGAQASASMNVIKCNNKSLYLQW